METRFILFREEPRWLEQAAAWFHQKWGVPQEAYRESMLACQDMAAQGVPTLYLLTDHTGFYERYGWEYLCPVRGDGEERDTRVYVHR